MFYEVGEIVALLVVALISGVVLGALVWRAKGRDHDAEREAAAEEHDHLAERLTAAEADLEERARRLARLATVEQELVDTRNELAVANAELEALEDTNLRARSAEERIAQLLRDGMRREVELRTAREEAERRAEALRGSQAEADRRVEQARVAAEARIIDISEPDDADLTLIRGIGPKLRQILNERGVTSLRQIAAFSEQDIDELEATLTGFPDRIRRDRWVSQATEIVGAGVVETSL